MPNSVTKRRSHVAILAAVAVLASLFVLPIAPAGAANGTADQTATYKACPEGAAPDAGFTDVAGNFAKDSIDCIKSFGVTTGTTATTYSPAQAVTRAQMALFLVRAAGPAGISVPAASDQGFTDIAALPQATQDAINQIKALGITTGTSATTYSPYDIVSRYQMALFLARFLSDAPVGPGGVDIDGTWTPDDTVFTDINNVSVESYNAIRDLFEMGVTTGTTATTFSPFAAVNRAQMAAFISRTLNHTNARPAGVWIQSDVTSGFGALSPALSVTYRDANFNPVANANIDVFEFTTATGKTAFKADGTCTTDSVNVSGATGTACEIGLTDFTTNSSGNLALISESVADGAEVTYYAWTAANGTSYDNDVHGANSVTVTSSKTATTLKVTNSIATNAGTSTGEGSADEASYKQVKFGETVTLTAQLTDGTNNVAKSAVNVVFTRTQYDKNGALVAVNSTTVATDANGTATFSFSQSDPSTTTGDDGYDEIGVASTGLTITGQPVNVKWLDAASVVSKLVLSQDSDYTVASDSGAGAAHTSKGTVYDQYGKTVSGVQVDFSNNDELLTPVARFTDSNGVATISWNRKDATSESDTLSAVAGSVADSGDLTIYWAVELADSGTSGGAKPVVVWDAANDALVYDDTGDTWTIVYYDTNDQFTLASATTYALFDAAVAAEPTKGDFATVNVTTYKRADADVSAFDLG